jgi:hypothetical protein
MQARVVGALLALRAPIITISGLPGTIKLKTLMKKGLTFTESANESAAFGDDASGNSTTSAKKLSQNLRRLCGRWRGRGFGSGWTCWGVAGSRATLRLDGSFWLARRIRLSSSLR